MTKPEEQPRVKNEKTEALRAGDLETPAVNATDETIIHNEKKNREEDTLPSQGHPTLTLSLEIPGYQIHEVIGQGGMGVVYRATDIRLGRDVAIKTIHLDRSNEALRKRFENEARLLAQLQHPGIVQIYEAGINNEQPYIVMELVSGKGLDAQTQGKPIDPKRAARLMAKLSEALQACHEKGVIHRDLKPSNVLMADINSPKLTDFGLAKLFEETNRITRTGDVMGTPNYMAPEQASGVVRKIGPGADVYGCGAMLYELLTGRPPFLAPDAMQILMMVLTQPPASIRSTQSQVPADLETITLKCLEKKTAHRYQSCSELAEDLNRFLQGQPIVARRTPVHRKAIMWAKRKPALASLIVFLALSISGWLAVVTAHNVQITKKNTQITEQNDLLEEKNIEITAKKDEVEEKNDQLKKELERSARIIAEGRKLSQWLLRDFTDVLESGDGLTAIRGKLAERTQKHLDLLLTEATDNESLKADLADAYSRLANLQGDPKSNNLGQYAEARKSLKKVEKLLASMKKPLNVKATKVAASLYLQFANLAQYNNNDIEIAKYVKLAQEILNNNKNGLPADYRLTLLLDATALEFYVAYKNGDQAAVKKNLKQLEDLYQKVLKQVDRPLIIALAEYTLATGYLDKYAQENRVQDFVPILNKMIAKTKKRNQGKPMTFRMQMVMTDFDVLMGDVLYRVGKHKEANYYYTAAHAVWVRELQNDRKNLNCIFRVANTAYATGDSLVQIENYQEAKKYYAVADKHYQMSYRIQGFKPEQNVSYLFFQGKYSQLYFNLWEIDRSIAACQFKLNGLTKMGQLNFQHLQAIQLEKWRLSLLQGIQAYEATADNFGRFSSGCVKVYDTYTKAVWSVLNKGKKLSEQ